MLKKERVNHGHGTPRAPTTLFNKLLNSSSTFINNWPITSYNKIIKLNLTMSSINLALVLIAFSLGLGLLGTLGYFVFKPVKELLLRSRASNELTKKIIFVQKVDDLSEDGNPIEAIAILPSILYLEIPRSAESISNIREINQLFLSRALADFRKNWLTNSNIEQLESLVIERTELIQLLFKAKYSFETIAGKREDSGKSLPKWTKDEFQRKNTEIDTALKTNFKLQNELEKLTTALKQGSVGEYLIH